MLLSVIICTRNRADEIVNCLPEVARQAREFMDVEVVVVDNGSTDNTKQVIAELSKSEDYPFRYVFEPVAGLCQARNRGRTEARGKVLSYIDDDLIIEEGWIRHIREHFLRETTDCLGGNVDVTLIGNEELDFPDDMLWFFGKRAFGRETREFHLPEHPVGGNMSISTRVFDEVGGFDTNLKLYGDETDFFRRASAKGFKMLYDPKVVVRQIIPANRLTKKELRSKSYNWGKGSATVWMLQTPGFFKRLAKIIEYFFRAVYVGVSSLVRSSFGKFYTFWYNCGYLAQLLKGLEKRS